MRRHRVILVLLVLILLAAVLSQCGDGDEVSKSEKVYSASVAQEELWRPPLPQSLVSPAASPAAERVTTRPSSSKRQSHKTRASRTRRSAGAASAAVDPSSVWARLAQCESGGNPTTNTGNGYYGMYQFALGTWHSVGGKGYPHQASAAEQTRRAKILQARSGWGQWPHCARKLGLI